MEYAVSIHDGLNVSDRIYVDNTPRQQCDDNYYRYVGWSESNESIQKYFSPDNIRTISHKITQLLQGVDPQNRPIIVPNKTICHVLSQIFDSYRPQTGDIFSRYNVPSGEPEDYLQSMIDQTIEIITNDIKNEIETIENNKKLTIWTTVYGDFNLHGLQQHSQIKVREKNTNHRGMVSFMNY